ncbi:MAG: rhodanese-like domain-containing protein [Chitinophagaceae bacterium]
MKSISPAALQKLLEEQPDTILIDVREPYENKAFNIGGALIPLGDIMRRSSEIPTGKPVILYCRKGIRSAIAIQRLEQKFGIDNLVNLEGGLEAWPS